MTMDIKNVDLGVFIKPVLNHKLIKDNILSAIEKMGKHSLVEEHVRVSNTDWHLLPSYDRIYRHFMFDLAKEHCEELKRILDYKTKIEPDTFWFQQYETGDFHDWHVHKYSMFSNVYYVELPEGSVNTTFKFLGREFQVKVKEGDILTFPSFLEHCSKPNQSTRKTVVSFNSN
jgi:mannose-6-phosphate isomerase-like protein (cupin superfamily)